MYLKWKIREKLIIKCQNIVILPPFVENELQWFANTNITSRRGAQCHIDKTTLSL